MLARASCSAGQNQLTPVCFFFFQAEDGIRDLTVTGVQTCALPIFSALKPERAPVLAGGLAIMTVAVAELRIPRIDPVGGALRLGVLYDLLGRTIDRSEERRVGEEGRSRWAPYH